MADSMNSPFALELPLSREALASLRAGDACTLSGAMYTLRDAGHMRLLDELHDRGCLPYNLEGATIFYAGPTPPAAGRPFGAVGPTTASRMDFAAPELHRAGIAATVGKGVRSQAVIEPARSISLLRAARRRFWPSALNLARSSHMTTWALKLCDASLCGISPSS